MESDESLNFVVPVSAEKALQQQPNPFETMRTFVDMWNDAFERFGENGRHIIIPTQDGEVVVNEISLLVPYTDGSYVCMVFSEYGGGEGRLISITEFDNQDTSGEHHSYTESKGQIVRHDSYSLPRTKDRFSMIGLYVGLAELAEIYHEPAGASPEKIDLLVDTFVGMDQDANDARFEESLGLNDQPVDNEELKSLAALLKDAVPDPSV